MSWVKGQIWKLSTIVAGIFSAVLISLLLAANFENRDLMSQRTKLVNQINDPVSGYIAQLAQSRTNVEQLSKAIEVQRVQFQTLAAQNNARLKVMEQQLIAAQARTASMQKRLSSFLATKPQGSTLEQRIIDIDQRGMTEMVK